MEPAEKAPNLMQALQNSMRYGTERQKVLARNIANIDTPGYRAKDLEKVNFATMAEGEAQRLSLMTTSPQHIQTKSGTGVFRTSEVRKPFEIAPNGNDVVLEDQMAKVSDNAANYEISSALYKKFTMMYRQALGQR